MQFLALFEILQSADLTARFKQLYLTRIIWARRESTLRRLWVDCEPTSPSDTEKNTASPVVIHIVLNR